MLESKYKDSAVYDAYYNAQLEDWRRTMATWRSFGWMAREVAGRTYNFAKIIETLRTYQPSMIVFADTGLFEYGDARWAGR